MQSNPQLRREAESFYIGNRQFQPWGRSRSEVYDDDHEVEWAGSNYGYMNGYMNGYRYSDRHSDRHSDRYSDRYSDRDRSRYSDRDSDRDSDRYRSRGRSRDRSRNSSRDSSRETVIYTEYRVQPYRRRHRISQLLGFY